MPGVHFPEILMVIIGTPETIGQSNRKLILKHLRDNGTMSRADLSRRIGMSFPAVSSNVKYLLEHHYILEVGAGRNSYGRKSTLLSFNANRGFVLGIDIGRFKVRCMLADLLGKPLAIQQRDHLPDSRDKLMEMVRELGWRVLAEVGVTPERILCVCAGLPGIAHANQSLGAPHMTELSRNRFEECMSREYPRAAILVENTANLGALGEHWKGQGAAYTDLVYISHGVGLGAALIINNSLYRGANDAAGQIGYLQLDPARIHKSFSDIGMLDELVSRDAIKSYVAGEKDIGGLADLIRQYQAGNPHVKSVLDGVSVYFGMALVNISAIVSPQAIIISGGLGKALGPLFIDSWRSTLANNLPFVPEVFFSDLDEREAMYGAIHMALDKVNEAPIAAG